MAYQRAVRDGLPLTRDNFTRPPLEMGIVPFWFWNGRMEPDEMDWQLRQYYDRGVRSLFLHARMGLAVPYLSDEWFRRVRFAVDKAAEIGIDAWVYDEIDWPSGTAGRQVMQTDPSLAQRYLEMVALPLDGPIFTFLEAHDDRYVNTGDSTPIAAYAVRRDEYARGIGEVIDLGRHLAWEKTIAWEAPPGRWMLLYFLEKTADNYIDTLDPASTARFIELTHERYREAVGDAFGAAVPGFFTDEPAMYYYHVGLQNTVVPWSRQMFKIFRERRGYDLKPFLPALYAEMDGQTARVRWDFWRTLTEQYAETYYGQIRRWCEEHDLISTGHLLFEEHLRLQARCEGNLFRYLEQLHLTGVDHLYPKVGSAEDPAQHVALKVGSSAAHHFGSPRLLCESMGGTYWDCTLERMKWINNWEYVLGVNLFNNHGYHYTIEGERKRDWPPSQFYHHTWWTYYDRFVDYNARLSHLLTGGRHVAKVLMLYPIHSIWTNYTPQAANRVTDTIERDFEYLTDTLLRLHYDFDYVDEDVLAEATVEEGVIRIADEVYSVFVLPPVTHVKASTHEQLERFVETGGHLVTGALVPEGLLDGEREGRITPVDRFFGADPAVRRAAFEAPETRFTMTCHAVGEGQVFHLESTPLFAHRLHADRLLQEGGPDGEALHAFIRETRGREARVDVDRFLEEEAGHDRQRREALREALHRSAAPDVMISDEHVFYLHRVKDDFDVYFLANITQEDRGRVTVSFEQVARPELWNPTTGAIEPIHVYRLRDGRLELELDFPPSEAHVVVLRGRADVPHVEETDLRVTEVEAGRVVGYAPDGAVPRARLAGPDGTRELYTEARAPRASIELPDRLAFEPEQPNVLVVGRWKMALEEDVDDPGACPAFDYDDGAWLDVEQGAWEPQLPQERDEQTYPVALWYRTHFEIREMPAGLHLMIDGFAGAGYRLFVNGTEVDEPGERSWLDAEIREVDVRALAREGRNTVAVRLEATRPTDGMLDLLKLTGDFALAGSADDGYAIAARPGALRVGDWTAQGFPFFSGTGVYRAEVEVPDTYLDGGRMVLEADCGEQVLEVRVNDGAPHVAPWHPYRLDVTDDLRAGLNTVEVRVTNTLINILEGVPQASGLFAAPRLVHEHRYELRA